MTRFSVVNRVNLLILVMEVTTNAPQRVVKGNEEEKLRGDFVTKNLRRLKKDPRWEENPKKEREKRVVSRRKVKNKLTNQANKIYFFI